MFIGHGLVAFAIVASVASRRGWGADRALFVGVVAGLFGTLPDVDMAYALVGVVGGAEGLISASDAFWSAAHIVHRGATHSLTMGLVAAGGFAAWRARSSRLWLAVSLAILPSIPIAGALAGGPLVGAVLSLFVLAGIGIVEAARRAGFGAQTTLLAALVGLLSHPFGDLLTGAPPALLYPFESAVLAERVTLHADPTMHLLGAFFVELATIWLALFVVSRLRGWNLFPRVRPRATLGIGYGAAVFAIPAPTLTVATPFVLTVLAVGLLGVPMRIRHAADGRWHVVATALTAVTVAALAYTSAYLVIG
jgi:membrane-bound metal-dependent hydrolase YbcI (DUF457 family)